MLLLLVLLLFDGAEFEAEPPNISSNKILLLLVFVFVLVLTLLSFEENPKSRRLLLLLVLFFFSAFSFSSPGFLILIPEAFDGFLLPDFLLAF